jgi:hypothetical protein
MEFAVRELPRLQLKSNLPFGNYGAKDSSDCTVDGAAASLQTMQEIQARMQSLPLEAKQSRLHSTDKQPWNQRRNRREYVRSRLLVLKRFDLDSLYSHDNACGEELNGGEVRIGNC